MSADGKSPDSGPPSEPRQFDVAESAAPSYRATSHLTAPSCSACSRAITSAYFEVDGATVCAPCRAALETPPGSRFSRAAGACALGVLCAAAGSLLYFGVRAATGLEFGFVAIVVGFIVGMGVRRGSRDRGGWPYQTLAVSLTYLAIVSTYVPFVAREFGNAPARDLVNVELAAANGPDVGARRLPNEIRAAASPVGGSQSDRGLIATQAGAPFASDAKPLPNRVTVQRLGFGTLLLGIAALVLLAAIAPIAAGFSNIMGLVIIGIAVFEAWMLNRRVVARITGPYEVVGDATVASAIT